MTALMLAVTITPKATEAIAQAPSMPGGIKGWAIGIGISLALAGGLKAFEKWGIPWFINWQMEKILKLLNAHNDPAWDEFEDDLILALVKLAQAKFPGDGLGTEREKLVLGLLTSRIPLLRGREEQVAEVIRKLVVNEKEMLARIKSEALARKAAAQAEQAAQVQPPQVPPLPPRPAA